MSASVVTRNGSVIISSTNEVKIGNEESNVKGDDRFKQKIKGMQPRFWASARNDQWEARTKDSMALLRSAVNGRKFSDEYMDSIMWALKVTARQTAQGSCVGFPFPFCG